MGPACKKINYLQSTGNPNFMGGQSIRGMVHRSLLGPLQVPKIPGMNHRWDTYIRPVQTLPTKHSRFPIETPRDAATSLLKDLIKAVKIFQDEENNHPGRHTKSLVILERN